MKVLFHFIQVFIFSFNILCLLLAIVVLALNALGLERSLPSTDEHTFFIFGIILSSFVCMTTLIGCYGVVCELFGVNLVYSLFIFMLLIMQYLQMHSYLTQTFYLHAVERLEHAWRLVDTKPYFMNSVESTYFCCGLYDSRDYNYKGLKIPKSCYLQNNEKVYTNLYQRGCLETLHDFYQATIYREKLCNWTLFGTECIVFICSIILSILLINSGNRSSYLRFEREVERAFIERPISNHINQRTNLFSD